jgi:hypothetical protein
VRFLVLIFGLVLISPAFARPKVAVTPFKGDKNNKVADAIAESLAEKSKVTEPTATGKAIKALGLGNELDNDEAKKLRKKLEVDAIVQGKLDKDGKKQTLKIVVFAKGKDPVRFTVEFKTTSVEFRDQVRDQIMKKIEAEDDKVVEDDKKKKREKDDDDKKKKKKEKDDDDDKKKKQRVAEDDGGTRSANKERRPRRTRPRPAQTAADASWRVRRPAPPDLQGQHGRVGPFKKAHVEGEVIRSRSATRIGRLGFRLRGRIREDGRTPDSSRHVDRHRSITAHYSVGARFRSTPTRRRWSPASIMPSATTSPIARSSARPASSTHPTSTTRRSSPRSHCASSSRRR